MPTLSTNYPVFILTLIVLFLFGLVYAWFVRKMADNNVQGQTAYTVVFGVGVTVLTASGLIGWRNVALLLACFAASGLPMIFEYVQRTHRAQKSDRDQAIETARDFLK